MVDTGDLKSPGLAAVRVRAPFRVSFESEFDTIRFWLFLFLHHKELKDLLCNVIEHRSPEIRKNQGNCINDNEQVFPPHLLSLHTLLTIIF